MSEKFKRFASAVITAAFLLSLLSGGAVSFAASQRENIAPFFTSYKDIPGVTRDEIDAVEALREKHGSFSYGVIQSTEAFVNENGEAAGFSVLLCEWLTKLFGISFELEFYDRITQNLLLNGEIDFTDEVRIEDEYDAALFMTENAVTHRSLEVIRMDGSLPVDDIAASRPLRYAFLETSASFKDAAAVLEPGSFEAFFAPDTDTVYQMLKSGEVDGFVFWETFEASFDKYGDVHIETFYPLAFSPVSLKTGIPELAPVISIVDKALQNGEINYINDLYDRGYGEYEKYMFFESLTDEELEYVKNNSEIVVSAVNWFYPICFYNKYEKKWEGIAFDAFEEVTRLSGINFTLGNGPDTSWAEIYEKLESGEIPINFDLIYTADRAERYVWSSHTYLTEKYALVSKQSFPDISVNKISYSKIGLMKSMAYTEMFNKWFPDAIDVTMYDTQDDAFRALDDGEIDLLMTGTNTLLSITNYYEYSGYKANVIFDSTIEYSCAFNKNEPLLFSVIEKALNFVDMEKITNQWESRTYDYQKKILRAQRPWLIGMIVLSFMIMILVLVLFIRSRKAEMRSERLVKKRTRELEHHTNLFLTVINSIPDHIFCKDLNSNFILCNDSLLKTFDLERTQVIGKSNADGLTMTEEEARISLGADMTVIKEAKRVTYEEQIAVAGGVKNIFETIKSPLIQDGEVAGIVGISRNITRRKEMEAEALAASQAKSTFLANMSHELRTPLNVIIGLTDLVMEENHLSKHVSDNMRKINSAGETLLGIVNDILDISKIESGKLSFVPAEYFVSSLLNDVTTLVTTRLGEKPVVFRLNLDKNTPNKLFGDDLRVKQIMNNLLSNALKHTHTGSIELTVKCKAGDEKDVLMEIIVSDTGDGIRAEDLKNLFTDYFQVENQANRKNKGTGLGLSITKRLSQMMGGEVSAQSEFGKGSTFRVLIRQGFVSGETIDPDVAESLRKFQYSDDKKDSNKNLERIDLRNARVLVVDDMQTNLDVASGLLRKYKMQVDCITNGHEAIKRIQFGKPYYNAVFMDHMMPEMDGIETTDAIRAIDSDYAREIPVIALTANAIYGASSVFYEHDFQDFISKPIDIMHLDRVIRKWVRNIKRDGDYENTPDAEKRKSWRLI